MEQKEKILVEAIDTGLGGVVAKNRRTRKMVGFYQSRRIRPGDVFWIRGEADFSSRWMKKVNAGENKAATVKVDFPEKPPVPAPEPAQAPAPAPVAPAVSARPSDDVI